MTPTPTGLDGLVGTVAVVLWYVGPALARDALDHLDQARHRTRRRKDRRSPGPGRRVRPRSAGPMPPAEPDDQADPEGPA
jgi:hypothetical protein